MQKVLSHLRKDPVVKVRALPSLESSNCKCPACSLPGWHCLIGLQVARTLRTLHWAVLFVSSSTKEAADTACAAGTAIYKQV